MTTPITALARRWRLEINLGDDTTPNWQICPGITEFTPTMPSNLEDSSSYDTDGWAENTKTGQSWQLAVTFNRKINDETNTYNAVHEAIRVASFAFGSASRLHVRFLDRNGLPEAYEGYAVPSWEPQGGEYTALDQVSCTMTGDGVLSLITNPVVVP